MVGSGTKTDPFLVDKWADFVGIQDGYFYALPAMLETPSVTWVPSTTPTAAQSIQNLFVWVDETEPHVNPLTTKPSFFNVTDNEEYPYLVCWGDYPSQEYMSAAYAASRETKVSGSLTTLSGNVQLLSDKDIKQNSLEIANAISYDDFVLPGADPSAELRVTLATATEEEDLYSAALRLSFWARTECGWYEVPLGEFSVYSAERDSNRGINIMCYDPMLRLDKVDRSQLGLFEYVGYPLRLLIQYCAKAADIPIGVTASDLTGFVNHSQSFNAGNADSSIETARDLVMHVSQVLNTFAYIDRWGNLQLKALRKVESKYPILPQYRKHSVISAIYYRLQELDMSVTFYEDGNNRVRKYAWETMWDRGVITELPFNPLWPTIDYPLQESEIGLCLGNIADELGEYQFKPASVTGFGDPTIELFDWVRYDGGSIECPITSYNWRYHSEHGLETCGREAVATVARSQADKKADASTANILSATDNVMREAYLRLIQTGYSGMSGFTYKQLAFFTYAEIGKEEET